MLKFLRKHYVISSVCLCLVIWVIYHIYQYQLQIYENQSFAPMDLPEEELIGSWVIERPNIGFNFDDKEWMNTRLLLFEDRTFEMSSLTREHRSNYLNPAAWKEKDIVLKGQWGISRDGHPDDRIYLYRKSYPQFTGRATILKIGGKLKINWIRPGGTSSDNGEKWVKIEE